MSSKNKKIVKDPLMGENPISIHVLGICSALAITTKIDTAVVMTIAVVAVLSISNVVISLLRNNIPNKVRIIIGLHIDKIKGILSVLPSANDKSLK